MILLAVETSGPVGSLALARDGRRLEERFLPELGRRHAQSLVPEAAAFLRRHDIKPADVNAVAVSVGPGSFTGLRVGVTFAKSFAYAAGAQLAAVETFRAIAENTPAAPSVVVLADAQQRGLIAARYIREEDGHFTRDGDLRVLTPDELAATLRPSDLLTGPAADRLPSSVAETAPTNLRHPRAASIARLGEALLRAGFTADPWTVEPLYVRKSAAEEKRDAADAAPHP